jgi:hypothetical protein
MTEYSLNTSVTMPNDFREYFYRYAKEDINMRLLEKCIEVSISINTSCIRRSDDNKVRFKKLISIMLKGFVPSDIINVYANILFRILLELYGY